MKFTSTTVGNTVEILASKDFQAIPVDFTEQAETADVTVLAAGLPLQDADGNPGILLYDVDVEANPNGALVVKGIIDAKKAAAHVKDVMDEDIDYTEVDIPGIVFRYNIGVTAEEGED